MTFRPVTYDSLNPVADGADSAADPLPGALGAHRVTGQPTDAGAAPPRPRPEIDREALDAGGFLLPHARTFQGIYNLFNKVYSYRWDEAVRHGLENAAAMRNDTYFRALLQERLGPLGLWEWDVEPDPDPLNPKAPHSNDRIRVARMLRAECAATPNLMKFRRHLGWCAWHGRSANQVLIRRDSAAGLAWNPYTVAAWEPVDGDKLQYAWGDDEHPDGPGHWCVYVNPADRSRYPDGETLTTDRTTALRLRRPDYRERFVVAVHEIEDAPYEDYMAAGRARGVGLRDYVYWGWWLRDEMLSWMISLAEKAGTLGLLVFKYPAGNAAAKQQAEDNAKAVNNRNAIAVPVQPGTHADDYGVEVVALPTEGLRFLKEVTFDYFDKHFERLFVGQTLSSGTEGSGLGGSGVADLHADTKFALLRFDALGQEECLTTDYVRVLRRLNHPDATGVYRWRYKFPNPKAKDILEAITKAASLPGRKLEFRKDDLYDLIGTSKPDLGDEVVGGDDQPLGGPGGGNPVAAATGGGGGTDPRTPGGVPAGVGGGVASGALGSHPDAGGPVPPELVAAVARAAESGDFDGAEELAGLADDPDGLRDLLEDTADRAPAGGGGQTPEDEVRDLFARINAALSGESGGGKPVPYEGPPRPGLVPKTGDPTHPGRWVKPEAATPTDSAGVSLPGGALGAHHESFSDHPSEDADVAAVVAANPLHIPDPASSPRVRDVVGKVRNAVYSWLYDATPAAVAILEAVADTPSDWAKFGYAPTGLTNDLFGVGVGVGTHLALSITSKVLLAAVAWVRRKRAVGGAPVPHSSGRAVLAYSWSAATTRTGKVKAVGAGDHEGRVLYGKRAEAALRAQQTRGTPDDPKERRKAAVTDARSAVAAAVNDPTRLNPDQLRALVGHLRTLKRDDLRDLCRQVEAKLGGVKQDLVNRLLDHVRKNRADRPTPGSALAADRPAGDNAPQSEPTNPLTEAAREPEPRPAAGDGPGGGGDGSPAPVPGGGVAEETGRPGDGGGGPGGQAPGEPAGVRVADCVPAAAGRVADRLNRFEDFFRKKGNRQAADWVAKLKDHVGKVGMAAALDALGPDRGAGDGGIVQYGGIDTESANWGDFVDGYLDRHGITPLVGQDVGPARVIHSQTNRDPWGGDVPKAGDFQPVETPYDTKLDEAKDLPGLESSEDLGVIVGKPVTHFTPEVVAKLDERYGAGKWIVKTYGDFAFAGQGIYFPQRIAAVAQDARNTIWSAGEHLARYGFELKRDAANRVVGLRHAGGEEYDFGTERYEHTVHGDAREWADKAAAAARHEHGTELDFGGKDFMAQPAFPVVGVTEEQRARGVTHEGTGEGRTHVLTRPDGSVEVIPHTTWIKGEPLPVVFESDDTRAMAKAAEDAIRALPAKARSGQVFAPDIVRTADGYKVVELNASVQYGGSGYLSDNPLVIDAFVSHLTGRTPGHVRFVRQLLTGRDKAAAAGNPLVAASGVRSDRTPGPRPAAGATHAPGDVASALSGVSRLPASESEGGRWDHPPALKTRHNREVLAAARKAGLVIDPKTLSHVTASPNVGGNEHDVHEDKENGRFYKFTKGGHYGQNKDAHEYLERLRVANELWPELDHKVHGFVTSPADGSPQLVTSMNRIEGSVPTAKEVEDHFRSRGWEPTEDDPDPDYWVWGWRHPETGTVVGDAAPHNFVKTPDGRVVPIDVDIQPGEPSHTPAANPPDPPAGNGIEPGREAGQDATSAVYQGNPLVAAYLGPRPVAYGSVPAPGCAPSAPPGWGVAVGYADTVDREEDGKFAEKGTGDLTGHHAGAATAGTPTGGSPAVAATPAVGGEADDERKRAGRRKDVAELHGRLQKSGGDRGRLAVLRSSASHDGSVRAEVAGLVLAGDGAKWQTAGEPADTPIGRGHDIRQDAGGVVRLNDVKTRASKPGVVITDKERLSKIGEVLQAAESGKVVVPGYTHFGTQGSTFVTGFPPEAEKTYSEVYDNRDPAVRVRKWKDAVRERLRNTNDLDSEFPAVRLSPHLTADFDAWTAGRVSSARAVYLEAAEFLASPEVGGKYQELIARQCRARVVDATRAALKAVGNDPKVLAAALVPLLRDNPAFVQEITGVEELQQAMLGNDQFRKEAVQDARLRDEAVRQELDTADEERLAKLKRLIAAREAALKGKKAD